MPSQPVRLYQDNLNLLDQRDYIMHIMKTVQSMPKHEARHGELMPFVSG